MDRRPDEDLASSKDFAKMARVGSRTIRRWIKEGYCPKPFKLGGQPRWRLGTIRRWLWEIEREGWNESNADIRGQIRTSPETTENQSGSKKKQV